MSSIKCNNAARQHSPRIYSPSLVSLHRFHKTMAYMRHFEKEKKSPVNNFFPDESGKLRALLSCACRASTHFVLSCWLMSEIPALDLPHAYQNNSNGSSVAFPALISQNFGVHDTPIGELTAGASGRM